MMTKLINKGQATFLALAIAFTLSCSDDKPDNPSADDFNIEGAGTVYFDGEAKAITITTKSGKSGGAITVYYEGKEEDQYPKVNVAPLEFGEDIVTFDVGAADGWNEAIGLPAGTLIIADGTPSVPTISSVAIQSSNSIKVSWGSVPLATSYKVFYITEDMNEVTLAEEVKSGTSFTHTGLTLNGTYYYFVIAVNKYGESTYSDFKALKLSAPVAPANLEASVDASNKITVRWGKVEGAANYRCDIYNGSTLIKQGSTTTGTSCAWSGLAANTTYTFRVVAINAVGESSYSSVSARTFAANYSAGLTAEVPLGNLVTLKWRYGYILDRWDVYCSVGSLDNFKLVKYKAVPGMYSFEGSSNTTYYCYVKVWEYNNYGGDYYEREGHSEIVSVRTGAALPPPPDTYVPAVSSPPKQASSGQKMCTTCSGNGNCHRSDAILVGNCQGGKINCSVCSGKGTYNNKTCTTCKGAGKVKCGLCNGTGKCSRCKGTGKV
jgi:hypothetical protein